MKKSLVLMITAFLILFVGGFFIEVKALTDAEIDALLQEKNLKASDLSLENRQALIAYVIDCQRKSWIIPNDLVYVDSWPGINPASYGVHTLGFTGLTSQYPAVVGAMYSPSKGTYQFVTEYKITREGLDFLKSKGIMTDSDIQNLYKNLRGYAHSFVIKTNSYNGVQYVIEGRSNAEPVFKKFVSGKEETLKY